MLTLGPFGLFVSGSRLIWFESRCGEVSASFLSFYDKVSTSVLQVDDKVLRILHLLF